jgi:hypothetical protein
MLFCQRNTNLVAARINGLWDLNPVKVEVPKWRLSRALNQDLQQFIGIRFDGLTNLDKFYDVDTPSYLATKDCGRRRRLASWCCVRPAVLRAPIINSQNAVCPAEWTDLSSLRARVAIGAGD